jgi:hypothetical protein
VIPAGVLRRVLRGARTFRDIKKERQGVDALLNMVGLEGKAAGACREAAAARVR